MRTATDESISSVSQGGCPVATKGGAGIGPGDRLPARIQLTSTCQTTCELRLRCPLLCTYDYIPRRSEQKTRRIGRDGRLRTRTDSYLLVRNGFGEGSENDRRSDVGSVDTAPVAASLPRLMRDNAIGPSPLSPRSLNCSLSCVSRSISGQRRQQLAAPGSTEQCSASKSELQSTYSYVLVPLAAHCREQWTRTT